MTAYLADLTADMELMALRLATIHIHLRLIGNRLVVARERIAKVLRN